MADFCNQCCQEEFGVIYGDLAGLSKEEDTRAGKFSIVLCESCGPIQVDHYGNCLSDDCIKQHGLKMKNHLAFYGVLK